MLRDWFRWELSRRLDMTLGVRLIILDRAVKCLVLTVGGVALIVATRTGALAQLASQVQAELNLASGSRLWLRLVNFGLEHLAALGRTSEYALGTAAILYGLLEALEAVGLILRRRWAEYLVLLATVTFVPVEVAEILRRPSPIKALTLAINVVIAVYLVWRKRLFLERPPEPGRPAPPASEPA